MLRYRNWQTLFANLPYFDFAMFRLAILPPKGGYDTQHTFLIHLDTKIIEIGLQMAKLDHVGKCGNHFATLPFFRTEKKKRRNFFLPHQNELGKVANERYLIGAFNFE